MNEEYTQALWHWIRTREQTRVAKEAGAVPPWTTDPIINSYHFCNVRRQDDRGTKEIQAAVQSAAIIEESLPEIYTMARLLNHAPSLTVWLDWYKYGCKEGMGADHPFNRAAEGFKDYRSAGNKIFNTAYVVSTCGQKVDKIDYITNVVRQVANLQLSRTSLVDAYNELQTVSGMGTFLSGQVIADLKNDRYLVDAVDWWTWSSMGPGSKKGLDFIFGGGTNVSNYPLRMEQLTAALPQDILDMNLHQQDLQNTLCEFSKLIRYADNLPGRRRTYHANI